MHFSEKVQDLKMVERKICLPSMSTDLSRTINVKTRKSEERKMMFFLHAHRLFTSTIYYLPIVVDSLSLPLIMRDLVAVSVSGCKIFSNLWF